jgi:hypothetical protein
MKVARVVKIRLGIKDEMKHVANSANCKSKSYHYHIIVNILKQWRLK